MSLRRQFIIVFVVFAVLLFGVGGVMAYRATTGVLEAELDDKLTKIAWAAAEVGLRADELLSLQPGEEETLTFSAVQRQLRGLLRIVDAAYVFLPDGTCLASSFPAEQRPIGSHLYELDPYAEEITRADLLGEATSPLFLNEEEGRHYKYAFVEIDGGPAILGVLGPANYMAPLETFRRTVILGSGLSALLAALLAWVLASGIARPLERLVRVALRIQRGRMDEAVLEEPGKELGNLSRAMERMREGILHRDEQLRLMLAQVAHEIRNPLGGLELFTSAAVETEDPEERARFLEKVRAEITALNRIIDDFLTFARPLRAQAALHDLRGPVREAAELMEMRVQEEGGVLSVELPREGLVGKADPEHVKRITLNLLRNAAQAGRNVRLVGENDRGEVVLSVSDDGPGVPRELEERIFEPFVTDKEQGAGLGLAIVKRLVEANQGRVELRNGEDAIGAGAEFRVYFRGAEDMPLS
jgi:signal transduction histidine kinase